MSITHKAYTIGLMLTIFVGPAFSQNLARYSDEFNGNELGAEWQLFNPKMADIKLEGGQLKITPLMRIAWFNGRVGPALFKRVRGDFSLTTRIKVRRASDELIPTAPFYQLAGLIARNPDSDNTVEEDWVLTVVGDQGGYWTNETKDTRKNLSRYHGRNTGRLHSDADIRLCRVGQRFGMYIREIGEQNWILESLFDRTSHPMPEELQVGPVAYANTNDFDVVGIFEWIRFEAVDSIADCLTNNESDI
jgi:hypothetical protein